MDVNNSTEPSHTKYRRMQSKISDISKLQMRIS